MAEAEDGRKGYEIDQVLHRVLPLPELKEQVHAVDAL